MEGQENSLLGHLQEEPQVSSPRGQSTPFTTPRGTPVPVITVTPSVATPSLEYDNSCLQDPFSGGESDLQGIHRLHSATDPNLLDNHQIPIVSTDISDLSTSLDSSFLNQIEAAGNLSPSAFFDTIMPSTINSEANKIFQGVDAVNSQMAAAPVANIRAAFLDDAFRRAEIMTDEAQACLALYMSWKRKYRESEEAALLEEVKGEVDSMSAGLEAYKSQLADKQIELAPPEVAPPPPPSNSTGNAELINLLQKEKALTTLTAYNQIKGEMAQLHTEVTALTWSIAEDNQIHEAMREVDKWKDRKAQLLNNWEAYKSQIYCWDKDCLLYTSPSPRDVEESRMPSSA